VISRDELKSDVTLKIFTMDNVNLQMAELDVEMQKKLQKEKEIDKLSFKNFRSFLPPPVSEQSTLLKEFRMKRDLEKQEGGVGTLMSRRGSKNTKNEVNPLLDQII
jgi:hypothetical protein